METNLSICPICGGIRKNREENKFFPFCSSKCKMADLDKWLSGEYSLPIIEPEIWSEDKEII
jgi:endogenous inhibitor of DNA gyrase (YacG/DUF329 family)